MQPIAAIDIGTNSVLYSLFALQNKILNEIHFERHSPRIGSRLKGATRPRINDDSYNNLLKILSRIIRHAKENKTDDFLIAATNPLRLAQNGPAVRKRLESDLGLPVEILTSAREARLSFLGAVGKLRPNQTATVIDLGGGSTEFVDFRGDRRRLFVSLPEGAVSLTERFDSVGSVTLDRFAEFENYLSRYRPRIMRLKPYLKYGLTLVGGTTSALAQMKNPKFLTDRKKTTLHQSDINLLVKTLAPLNTACRRRLLETDKKRAEIIFAGAFWLGYLFNILDIKKGEATPRGLRHGLVAEHLGL